MPHVRLPTSPRANFVSTLSILSAVTLAVACPRASSAVAKVPAENITPFVRGVGLGLFATDPDYDYGVLLDEIVAHGATDVLIVVSHYQADVAAHVIAPREGYSPRRETVVRTLRAAKDRGLRVALLPIVRLERRTRTEWRGRIAPTAGIDAWFTSYRAFIVDMAAMAKGAGIERFGVGSELLSMERHTDHWRALIDDVRSVYDGKLFYSANWDHFDPIQFWDALDEVGVTAYFELAKPGERRDTAALVDAWIAPRRELARLRREKGKPLFITEIGYPSKSSAAEAPWDETRAAPVDLALQASLYDAYCQAFRGQGIVDGFYFWNWFGFGGDDDGTYTPRKKPAAKIMQRCLADRGWDARLKVSAPPSSSKE